MGSFSDYTENKVLDHLVGKTSFTMPTAYIALFTTAPNDAGGGTEVSGGSYTRIVTAGIDWNVAASGAISSANAITFPQATSNWGTITHFALFDAAAGGSMLVHSSLTTPQPIGSNDTAKFAAGDLEITLD